jgi:hypothetical protein
MQFGAARLKSTPRPSHAQHPSDFQSAERLTAERDQGAASSRGCVNDPNHWLACAKERRQGSRSTHRRRRDFMSGPCWLDDPALAEPARGSALLKLTSSAMGALDTVALFWMAVILAAYGIVAGTDHRALGTQGTRSGCMRSRSEAPSKFQVPKSAGLLSATRLPLYALISRARENGGGHMGNGPCPILPPRPTGSITGYGATQFNCIAESIPLKGKASPIPLHRV